MKIALFVLGTALLFLDALAAVSATIAAPIAVQVAALALPIGTAVLLWYRQAVGLLLLHTVALLPVIVRDWQWGWSINRPGAWIVLVPFALILVLWAGWRRIERNGPGT